DFSSGNNFYILCRRGFFAGFTRLASPAALGLRHAQIPDGGFWHRFQIRPKTGPSDLFFQLLLLGFQLARAPCESLLLGTASASWARCPNAVKPCAQPEVRQVQDADERKHQKN